VSPWYACCFYHGHKMVTPCLIVHNNRHRNISPQYGRTGNVLAKLIYNVPCVSVSDSKGTHLMISKMLHDCMPGAAVHNEFQGQETNGAKCPYAQHFQFMQCY
jgi:hypothetical protein